MAETVELIKGTGGTTVAFQTQESGVAVLAYAVDFVRTAMTEYLAYAPEAQAVMGDGPRRLFEEGRDTPMDEAVSGFMFIASGQADALSGCHLSNWGNLTVLAQRAEATQRDELYMLRLRTEPSARHPIVFGCAHELNRV